MTEGSIDDRRLVGLSGGAGSIEEFLHSPSFMRYVIDALPDIVIVKDAIDFRIIRCNRAACELFGRAEHDLIGRHINELLPPEAAAAAAASERAAVATRRIQEVPLTSIETLSGTRLFRTRRFPVESDDGVVRIVITISDDITDAHRTELQLADAYERAAHHLDQLEKNNRAMLRLNELGDLLQGSLSFEEAYAVVADGVPRIFSSAAGALGVMKASRNFLEVTATWGDWPAGEDTFDPSACWALRRGRLHLSSGSGPRCGHSLPGGPGRTLCVPMVAQGDTVGTLHLVLDEGNEGASSGADLDESLRRLALMTGEQIGMAISNLTLRERLRHMSIRDPLTDLFNRRYMEETLDREIERARHNHQPLSVVQIDIDHFKNLNDQHGHEAGDVALKAVADILQHGLRAGDVACRYGGEEMTLILPDIDTGDATRRLNELTERLRATPIPYRGATLVPPTLSIGIAAFPEHADGPEELLRVADEALYRAKSAGRDQIVVAGSRAARD